MTRWVVRVLSVFCIVVLLAGLGYGALVVWISSVRGPLQRMVPSLGIDEASLGLGLGEGAGAGGAGGGVAAPPPPAARRSGPGIPHTAPPPPPKHSEMPKDGSTVADAAPPTSPVEVKSTRKTMLALGCALSFFSFANPFIAYWSFGGDWLQTISFHSLCDMIATSASCLAWLMFGITQLHTEGTRVFGIEAVIVNLMGAVVYTCCIIVKMASVTNGRTKGCIGGVIALCGPPVIITCLVVFGRIERDSLTAIWISFVATLVQAFSQLLPFHSFYVLLYPPANAPAQHADAKKFIIYSRSCNLIVSVYWAMFCVFTYEHNFFELANVAGAIFAFISFALHIFYALKPQDAEP